MGRNKHWTQDEIDKAFEMRRDGKSAVEIAEAVGRSYSGVRMVLMRYHDEALTVRYCAHCNKAIRDVEAVFCSACGHKILSEKDKVLQRLLDIGACMGEFPNSFRERIMADVSAIRRYIEDRT